MANIYLCHAPEDRAAAEKISAALGHRGHRLLIDATLDDGQRASLAGNLKHCDAVIVLLSPASVASRYVRAVIAEAIDVNRLVLVRAAGFAAEKLPPDLSALRSLEENDIDGIDRVIAISGLGHPTDAPKRSYLGPLESESPPPPLPPSPPPPPSPKPSSDSDYTPKREGIGAAAEPPRPPLLRPASPSQDGTTTTFGQPSQNKFSDRSRVEGVGSAAEPPRLRKNFDDVPRSRIEGVGAAASAAPRAAPAIAPQQDALAAEAGRLVHKIPEKMWVGEQETVEVRLGRLAAEGLTLGLAGRGALTSQDIAIVETMSVSIYTKGGAFDIERQSETTQLVSSDQLKGTAFEQANYGRWIWLVTPRKAGTHQLFVKVSASLKDSRGLPTSASLPDREFPVSVSVNAGKTTMLYLRRGLLAAGGTIGAALLGAITQELWWPKLKILLQGWGLLT